MILDLTIQDIDIIRNALLAKGEYHILSRLEEQCSDPINTSLNESIQLLDKIKYNKERGYVIGQIEGKWIVQVQGNTYMVDEKDLKEYNAKPDTSVKPHMKFDEKTLSLLFEQFVKCGIYQGNVPLKMNDCYVRYNTWEKAQPEQKIQVLIEGNYTFMPKSNVQVFEDPNDFANQDDYVPGVIIDESTEEVIENILLNAIDYTSAIGDADSIRIIKQLHTGEQEMQTVPKSMVRTVSV